MGVILSSSWTSRIHSFHKQLNTYYVPSAQRGGVYWGLDRRGSINPFPRAPFFSVAVTPVANYCLARGPQGRTRV